MSRDYTVTVTRTIGMIFIVMCHLFGYGPISSLSFLSEVFNVGTSLFIFISGFLYGKKVITNDAHWIFSRYKRICFPMYIWVFLVFIYRLIFVTHTAEPIKYLLYLFNIQGIPFVYNKLDYSVFSVADIDQLWFLTVIMLCYLCVPLLRRIKPWIESTTALNRFLLLIALIILQVCLSFFGFNIYFFILFTVGYFVSDLWDRALPIKKYISFTALTVVALSSRFICRIFLQSTNIYPNVIVPLTQSIFAVWIYLSVFLISKKLGNTFNKIASSRAISYIDELSFYIYMTHFIFIAGSLSTLNLTASLPLNIAITILLIILSSVILNLLCRTVLKRK